MASAAYEQLCKYLDNKEISFGKDESRELIYFGYSGLVHQSLLFRVDNDANIVQFRSVEILDEDDLKNYHENEANRVKLYEYLLKCNYTWKLGKFSLDPEDPKVDLYFVLSDFVEVDKGVDEELIDRAWNIIFGPSFAHGVVEKAIRDIKSILATGEKAPEEEDNLPDLDGIESPEDLANKMRIELSAKAAELIKEGKIEEAKELLAMLAQLDAISEAETKPAIDGI